MSYYVAIMWSGTYLHAARADSNETLCGRRAYEVQRPSTFDPDDDLSCASCARSAKRLDTPTSVVAEPTGRVR